MNLRGKKRIEGEGGNIFRSYNRTLYDNFNLPAIFPLDCTRVIKDKRIVKRTQSTFRVMFVQFRVEKLNRC